MPTPLPSLTPVNILPDSTWIAPIAQAVIGVLFAGILIKMTSDFWHTVIAKPDIQGGFLQMSCYDKAAILSNRILQPQELNAQTIAVDLCIKLDTRMPFAKDKWETRVNIIPDENVHIEGLTMYFPRPKSYRLYSGLITRGTNVMLRGMLLAQPFADIGRQGSIRMYVTVENTTKIIPLTFRTT